MPEFRVSVVIDGDTFEVANGWKWNGQSGSRVRPTGYDAPEINTIAGQQWPAQYIAHHAGNRSQVAVFGRKQIIQLLIGTLARNRPGAETFQIAAQQDSLSFDAIDAKQEIQNRSDQRQEPNEADPKCRRARVAFVQERMSRA